ncbi:MAG: RNA polymerase sigma factor [Fimbriimonadales bacterium]
MQAVQEKIMRPAVDITEVAKQHYTLVYRFCARRVGVESAQDAAQETFLTAQRVSRNFRGESTLKTWLLGIAHNECRRVARNRRLEPPCIELRDDFGSRMSDVGCGESSFAEVILNRQTLSDALNKLSPEHREVVLLHEVEGLSYDEAAAVIGVPSGTVKSRLHFAFLNLRRSLSPGLGETGSGLTPQRPNDPTTQRPSDPPGGPQ